MAFSKAMPATWFRPDLRGWKTSRVLSGKSTRLLVPTRLEGMENMNNAFKQHGEIYSSDPT